MILHAQQRLDAALDAHAEVLAELNALSEDEPSELLSFDTEAIADLAARKATLVEDAHSAEEATRDAAFALRVELDVSLEETPTLSGLLDALPRDRPEAEAAAAATRDRLQRLRALVVQLQDLQDVAVAHAERGLRAVNAYAMLLSSAGRSSEPLTYRADGSPRSRPVPAHVVSRTA